MSIRPVLFGLMLLVGCAERSKPEPAPAPTPQETAKPVAQPVAAPQNVVPVAPVGLQAVAPPQAKGAVEPSAAPSGSQGAPTKK